MVKPILPRNNERIRQPGALRQLLPILSGGCKSVEIQPAGFKAVEFGISGPIGTTVLCESQHRDRKYQLLYLLVEPYASPKNGRLFNAVACNLSIMSARVEVWCLAWAAIRTLNQMRASHRSCKHSQHRKLESHDWIVGVVCRNCVS